jgi:pilus assembly protein Flp/PilA
VKPCQTGAEPNEGDAREEEVKMEMLRALPMRAYLALQSVKDREDGQAMVEYALLLSLIAIVSIAVLTTLGTKVSSVFDEINNDF